MKNLNKHSMLNYALILLALLVATPGDVLAQKKKKSGEEDPYIFKIDKRELNVQSLFIEGMNEKMLGNLEDAIGLFNAVLKLDPENHAAYYELSRIAYENNDLTEAEEFAYNAVKLNPKNEWYHIYYAEAKAHQGDYEGAAEAYQGLVDTNPEKWEYLQDVGYMYAQAGQFDKAIEVYDELEKFQGFSEELVLQKQSLYIKMGKVEKAADEIRRGIAEVPDREHLYILLGEIYSANELYKKAIESYELLLEREEDHPQALLAIAEIQRQTGDETNYLNTVKKVFTNKELNIDTKIFMFIPYIELLSQDISQAALVLEMAEMIMEAHPDDAKAVTAYADVLLNSGEKDQAIEVYKQASTYEESPLTVWIQLFDLFIENEDYGAVLEYGEKAAKKYPKEVAPWFYLGAACMQVKDYECAVQKYSAGLKLGNINPEIAARMWSTMGDAHNELGHFAQSDSCYDEALVINPNDAFTLNNYAYYLSLREERLDKAEKMSKRSNLLVEGNSAFLDTYAWIKYQQEDYETALNWMKKAIDVMDSEGIDRPVLLEHYGDILLKVGEVEAALDSWNRALEAGGDKGILEAKIRDNSVGD